VPVELLQGRKQAGSEGQSQSLKVNGHHLWCRGKHLMIIITINNNNDDSNNNNDDDDDNKQ